MSTQNTETPQEFVTAVENYLGIKFKYDLAGTEENKKAPIVFTESDNSLSIDWPTDGWCWLNPTFKNLTKWVAKCHEQYVRGCKIVTLWPLSGDLNMIYVWKNTDVYIVHGRIWPLVRGCMICKFDFSKMNNTVIHGVRWNKKLSILAHEF